MVYNLSFINYVGGRVFDEIEQLKELEEETRVNLYNVSADLKDEIEATSVNQTVKMQRIGDEIKAANKNQTREMQQMTKDLKKSNNDYYEWQGLEVHFFVDQRLI